MTKERLKKLRGLIKEAEHLQRLIDEPMIEKALVVDTILDYGTGQPVPQHIVGYGDGRWPQRQHIYHQKLREIQAEIAEIEKWLSTVTDTRDRDVIRLVFVMGLSYEQSGTELGISTKTVQRRINKYLG